MARVAVVIPARDEEATIERLLDSLLAQSRRPTEIVVVDAGSSDETANLVAAFSARDATIRLVRSGPSNPGTARNEGVESTSAEWIAFTDAGIRVEQEWLERLLAVAEAESDVDVVYGSYEPELTSYFEECAALAYIPAPTPREGGMARGPSLASSLFRRAVWEEVGGFPAYRAAEDLIFMEAAERAGARIAFAPGAVVHWQIPSGWRSTLRRFSLYSKHNLIAGRGRYWHRGVLRQYVAVVLALSLTPFSSLFLLAPPLWLGARVGRTLWRKRRGFPIAHPLRPDRWAMVASILLLIDLATLSGAISFVRDRSGARAGAGAGDPSAQYPR
jgi:glycosyltransferase involved in cell wall biosynthesis